MKKLIVLLIIVVSVSAQEVKFGASMFVKKGNIETVIIDPGFWGGQLTTTRNENFTAVTFNADMTLDFTKNISAIVELGYTINSEKSAFYEGMELGLYYGSNKLLDDFYFKTGFYAHINFPDHPTFSSRTIAVGLLGVGWRFVDNVSLEVSYHIPISKTYLFAFSREMKLKNIIGIGFKIVI